MKTLENMEPAERKFIELMWLVEALGSSEEQTACIEKLSEAKEHFAKHLEIMRVRYSNIDTNGPQSCEQ